MPLGSTAYWALVVPVGDRTNLLSQSPSFERGTAGWGTIQAGTIGTTSTFQQFGAWSGSVAPTSNGTTGARSPTFTAGNGTTYTASAYIRGVNGIPYRFGVGDSNGANMVGSTTFTGGGTWQRYSFSWTEASGATRALAFKKDASADTSAFYIDGVQVEAGGLTTYIDGDGEGCYWLGAPHASPSTRSGTYRGGGSIVALEDFGLKPDQHMGIGMPPQEITSQSYALQPGAEYQRSRAGERPFTLTFQPILGTTQRDFHVTRREIINAIKPDLIDPQQPVRFWYTGGQGTVQIDAVYSSGLELGEMDGPMAENGAVTFVAHDPFWYATTQEGVSLADSAGGGGRSLIGSTNYIAYRDRIGRWGSLPFGGVNGEVLELLPVDGTVFVGGQFGSAFGTVARLIAQWNDAVATGGTLTGGTLVGGDSVYALGWSPAGTLFVGGNFNTAAGTTNSRALAAWTGAWGTLGGTVTPGALGVRALKYNAFGTLFVGGDFTAARGTTAFGIAMLTAPNTWGTLTNGTLGGLAASVNAIIQSSPTREIILTGDFDTAGGTTANNITQWSGTFGTLSAGLNDEGQALAIGANGVVYVGGAFGSAGAYAASLMAQWNGIQFTPLGNGLAGGAAVRQILPLTNGNLIVVGDFNRSGSTLFPDRMTSWNGYTFTPLDVDLPGANQIQAVVQMPSGTTYVGGAFVGTAHSAVVTQAVNTGMGDAYPIVKARNTGAGTVRLYQLVNTTTGLGLYFNHVLATGEEVTLTTEPGGRSFTSSFAGNIFNTIVPGSNNTGMHLKSGTNYISFFADSGSVAASMYWQPSGDSVDMGTVY